MPKRKPKKKSRFPAGLVTLAVVALVGFAAGEAWLLLNSDSGRLKLARYFGLGDPARITLAFGRQVHRGLAAFGVPPDSIQDLGPAARDSSAPGTPGGPPPAGAGRPRALRIRRRPRARRGGVRRGGAVRGRARAGRAVERWPVPRRAAREPRDRAPPAARAHQLPAGDAGTGDRAGDHEAG